jgi:hypothetical protein
MDFTSARVLLAGPDTIHLSLDLEISDELRSTLLLSTGRSSRATRSGLVRNTTTRFTWWFPTAMAAS